MKRVMVLAATIALLGVAGCGGDDEEGTGATTEVATAADTAGSATEGGGADGAAVFASAGCGGCHTLKAAGSSGNVGPNLDELMPDKETVAEQVRTGGGVMPSFEDRLSAEEIDAVAEYVSSSAGA